MKKILITDGMDKNAVQTLKNKGFNVEEKFYDEDNLKEKIKEVDAVVVRSATKIKKDIIDEALKTGRLKMIIRGGVGLDNIDVDYATGNNIVVKNTPLASTNAVAELVLCEMLVLSRHVKIANLKLKNGIWDKKNLKGNEIAGKVLGLVGFGRIANSIADKAVKLGMKVLYTDIDKFKEDTDDIKYAELEEVIKNADFVTVHTPLTDKTKYMFDKKQFEMMKDTAFFINCARGGIANEQALLDAINEGQIAGAAIDCFEDEPAPMKELLDHPKVSVTPHIGASTEEAQMRIGDEITDIITDYFL
ncbi:D-2-hydroxyacid dehydrogenase [Peptostreptococcus faecalis]|uniref:D-2-hydroxyacid dehydrogenase n=1 Tax=Peptostreptococcus faecalis TaxID=2045015 RepID=UPI000C79BAA1|nr:D-2-hydroxyacid dehydrogenase [Peptostreptococcus faecalis]